MHGELQNRNYTLFKMVCNVLHSVYHVAYPETFSEKFLKQK